MVHKYFGSYYGCELLARRQWRNCYNKFITEVIVNRDWISSLCINIYQLGIQFNWYKTTETNVSKFIRIHCELYLNEFIYCNEILSEKQNIMQSLGNISYSKYNYKINNTP